MSFFESNLEQIKLGFKGEEIVRNYLKKKKVKFMQIDLMFVFNKTWYLGEIKSQEKFKAPPYDGHGLPEWQINDRIGFYNDTKIIPYLIVYDLEEECLYVNDLLTLLSGEYFKTKGDKPRIIFNIKSFKKIEINEAI